MTSFKTSIRVDDDATFGAVVDRHGDLMISLDGPFIEGTIVLKISQEQWGELCHAVLEASVKDARRKGYKI
jgi:hypothetical protein